MIHRDLSILSEPELQAWMDRTRRFELPMENGDGCDRQLHHMPPSDSGNWDKFVKFVKVTPSRYSPSIHGGTNRYRLILTPLHPKYQTNFIPRRDLRLEFHVLGEQLLRLKDLHIVWFQSTKSEEFDLRKKWCLTAW